VAIGSTSFYFAPRTKPWFQVSSQEHAAWLTGHIHPLARAPLSQLLSRPASEFRNIDWSRARSVSKFRRPGVYIIIVYNDDGTVRAVYIGSASAGCFLGSLILDGPHARGLAHDSYARSATPPLMQIYLSDDGIGGSNKYDIKLLLGCHKGEISTDISTGLNNDHITVQVGSQRATVETLPGLMLREEDALMSMVGCMQRGDRINPCYLGILQDSPLRNRVVTGLNVGNALERYRITPLPLVPTELGQCISDWGRLKVKVHDGMHFLYCNAEIVHLTDDVPAGDVEGHFEVDGGDPTLYLRNPANHSQNYTPVTRFMHSIMAMFGEDSGASRMRQPDGTDCVTLRFLHGTSCRKILRQETESGRVTAKLQLRSSKLSTATTVDSQLFPPGGSEYVSSQVFFRLPPGVSPLTAERSQAQPRLYIASCKSGKHSPHPNGVQLISRLTATFMNIIDRQLKTHGLNWRDFTTPPRSCPRTLLDGDRVHSVYDDSQLACKRNDGGPSNAAGSIWDMIGGSGHSFTLTRQSGPTNQLWHLRATICGLDMYLGFPEGSGWKPGEGICWIAFDDSEQEKGYMFVERTECGTRAVLEGTKNKLIALANEMLQTWNVPKSDYRVRRPAGIGDPIKGKWTAVEDVDAWFRALEESWRLALDRQRISAAPVLSSWNAGAPSRKTLSRRLPQALPATSGSSSPVITTTVPTTTPVSPAAASTPSPSVPKIRVWKRRRLDSDATSTGATEQHQLAHDIDAADIRRAERAIQPTRPSFRELDAEAEADAEAETDAEPDADEDEDHTPWMESLYAKVRRASPESSSIQCSYRHAGATTLMCMHCTSNVYYLYMILVHWYRIVQKGGSIRIQAMIQ
jgi:hypothetical protein